MEKPRIVILQKTLTTLIDVNETNPVRTIIGMAIVSNIKNSNLKIIFKQYP